MNQALLELFGPPRHHRLQSGSSPDLETDLSILGPFRSGCRGTLSPLGYDRQAPAPCRRPTAQGFLYGQCDHHKIREILRWDDKTLILVFDHFVLADDLEDEAQLYYCDLPTFRLLRDNIAGYVVEQPSDVREDST